MYYKCIAEISRMSSPSEKQRAKERTDAAKRTRVASQLLKSKGIRSSIPFDERPLVKRPIHKDYEEITGTSYDSKKYHDEDDAMQKRLREYNMVGGKRKSKRRLGKSKKSKKSKKRRNSRKNKKSQRKN